MRKLFFTFSILFFAPVMSVPTMNVPVVQASELIVSAASSLANAFSELKEVFVLRNPKTVVYVNFASSNNLFKQIEEGAPVNIFASADQITMDRAEYSKLIEKGTRENFALNSLVLVVPFDAKNIPKSPEELLNKEYKKIAIGNIVSVPAGRYAQESLKSEKLWDTLESRLVYGENVRQVLDYVARGEVDAGFVYATDAIIQKNKVKIAVTMQGHQPVLYPIALLKNSKNKKEAQEFLDFVFSDEGAGILARYGFAKP